MGVNPYIRFGISRLGRYLLDYIPEEHIEKYLVRLKYYSVTYQVVTREYKLKFTPQQVCYIVFFHIEKKLIDKLKTAYGFIDKREYSIPISNDLICFTMDNKYVISFNKDLSNQMKNYFNQHTDFAYKLIFVDRYAVCIPKINLCNAIFEDINNSIGITNEYDSNQQKKQELLSLRNLINRYQKQIKASRHKQAVFNFGDCFGYPLH